VSPEAGSSQQAELPADYRQAFQRLHWTDPDSSDSPAANPSKVNCKTAVKIYGPACEYTSSFQESTNYTSPRCAGMTLCEVVRVINVIIKNAVPINSIIGLGRHIYTHFLIDWQAVLQITRRESYGYESGCQFDCQ
jgi:hypothetical protein